VPNNVISVSVSRMTQAAGAATAGDVAANTTSQKAGRRKNHMAPR